MSTGGMGAQEGGGSADIIPLLNMVCLNPPHYFRSSTMNAASRTQYQTNFTQISPDLFFVGFTLN